MFLSSIFRKYKDREYRLVLIKDLISWLEIDDNQKNLYLDSLEVLDGESLERFYNKLTSVIEIIEEDENKLSFQKNKQEIYKLNTQEQQDKRQELNSFNLILDNI
ncbi:MAG: hypothetical protein ACD_2C00221G0008 [uncultured bacterium (gcode 4)]|uniref:Uncharacterized protein n=1 Tax=uncultured bacterium (gcode 4) TaxID=1234023 RepID=K2FDF3_9BACT|nr:MAG: hypothetical protein ACD_2C00221G0008 [uncultured bacterium (gcode 4)]